MTHESKSPEVEAAKKAVLATYPDAHCVDAVIGCGIFTNFNDEGVRRLLSGCIDTEDAAWIDAASRLALSHSGEEKEQPLSLCGVIHPDPAGVIDRSSTGPYLGISRDADDTLAVAESTANANTSHHYIRDGYRGTDAIDATAPKVVAEARSVEFPLLIITDADRDEAWKDATPMAKGYISPGELRAALKSRERRLLESIRREAELKDLLEEIQDGLYDRVDIDDEGRPNWHMRMHELIKEKVGA